MSDLRAKLAAAGDRETVELPGIGTVEVRSCRLRERDEFLRLGTIAGKAKEANDSGAYLIAVDHAQAYLIAVTLRDPQTGERIFQGADDVLDTLSPVIVPELGEVASRVCGLDKLAEAAAAAKNGSGATGASSTESPAISIALSRNSEDGSLHLSSVSA